MLEKTFSDKENSKALQTRLQFNVYLSVHGYQLEPTSPDTVAHLSLPLHTRLPQRVYLSIDTNYHLEFTSPDTVTLRSISLSRHGYLLTSTFSRYGYPEESSVPDTVTL